jgi:hypothetical protein
LWDSGSWGVVNTTNSKHFPTVRHFRWPEAVGYPHIYSAVGFPSSRDTGDKEFYELAAFLISLGSIFFDLFYAVTER